MDEGGPEHDIEYPLRPEIESRGRANEWSVERTHLVNGFPLSDSSLRVRSRPTSAILIVFS